jgi:hypothetical protein
LPIQKSAYALTICRKFDETRHLRKLTGGIFAEFFLPASNGG